MENGKVIEQRICHHCGLAFVITDRDLEFYDKVSPMFGSTKYSIPSPTLCPDCRQQRRLSFRNERTLYHRKCNRSGKTIISMFAPEKAYTVYSPSERYGDSRDACDYGVSRDENKSFFTQFDMLLHRVPQIGMISVQNQNCDYNNFGAYSKNCYLCFDYGRNEDCCYLSRSYRNTNCLDLSSCSESSLSIYLTDCTACVKSRFCMQCEQCFDCGFCYACIGSSHCFMCTNLANKQFHIFNVPYSKEEYDIKVTALKARGTQQLQSDFEVLLSKTIRKYATISSCDRCTGDYLIRCKNCHEVYGAKDTEDCTYVVEPMVVNNLYDDTFSGNNCSYSIETIGCESSSHLKYCFSCRSQSSDLSYCHFCIASHHCFGCIGLRDKEYCILNKQYTREEYEKLVPQIIEKMIVDGEWGEFFPSSISLFGYNETLANEYFPLSREEVIKKGFKRCDYEPPFPHVERTLQANEVPEIKQVTDDILQHAIICEVSGKPFKIIRQELEFYRKHHLPIPKRHPDQRHFDRMALRNPRKLRDRTCAKCGTAIKTSYAPERKEIVYCESCYNKEIYG